MSVGMPAYIYLQEFGSHVWHAFGSVPYQVGSSLKGKVFRDVDVRLILEDEVCKKLFGSAIPDHTCGRWSSLCMAFSALGAKMTGLPIDFQIQGQTHANEKFKGEPRNSLGIVELRFCKADQKTPEGLEFPPCQ